MKKYIVYILTLIFCNSSQSQNLRNFEINGSWLNSKVVEYYKSNKTSSCNVNSIDFESFAPLSLSFRDSGTVNVYFKIEQEIHDFKIGSIGSDSILLYKGNMIMRLSVFKDSLRMTYQNQKIIFQKISENYSSDVFAEFILGEMFNKNENYYTYNISENSLNTNDIIHKQNFKNKIKEIFKCDNIDFVKFGSIRIQNMCLPIIALYSNSKWSGPIILGIKIKNEEIIFYDSSEKVKLILKPSR